MRGLPGGRGVLIACGYAALLGCLALLGYFEIFALFAPGDDEGYLNLTLRHFLAGHALYDDVATQYGPFYYEFFGGFFKLTGAEVSTNTGRLLQLGMWVWCAGALGACAHKLSGRWALGLVTAGVTFVMLRPLVFEPMHPGGLLCALLAAFAVVATFVVPARPRVGMFALGAVAAAVTLTKVNVGGFLLIALGFAAAMTLGGLPSRPWPRRLICAGLVGVAPVLLLPDIGEAPVRNLAVAVAAGALALVIVSRPDSRTPASWWRLLAIGVVCMTVVVTLVVLALGSGLSALIDGVLIRPTEQRNALFLPPPARTITLPLAVVVLGAAAAVRSRALDLSAQARGSLRLLAGLAIWAAALAGMPTVVGRAFESEALLVPLLVWVAAAPVRNQEITATGGFVRLALVAAALLQTLHVYPVAGSQVAFGAILYPLVGALCLHDGLTDLGTVRAPWPRLLPGALAVALLFVVIARDGLEAHRVYRDHVALPFEGAQRLHVSQAERDRYVRLVRRLRVARCSVLVSMPGQASASDWAGLDAPVGLEFNAWTLLLNRSEQRAVVDRVRAEASPCVLYSRAGVDGWQNGKPLRRLPLVNYVSESVRPVWSSDGFELRQPPGRG